MSQIFSWFENYNNNNILYVVTVIINIKHTKNTHENKKKNLVKSSVYYFLILSYVKIKIFRY